jgi:hypothetical protein
MKWLDVVKIEGYALYFCHVLKNVLESWRNQAKTIGEWQGEVEQKFSISLK